MSHAQLVDGSVIAQQLRKLSDKPLLSLRRDELRCLAADLEGGTCLDEWAEIDLLQAFARPESLAPDQVPPPPRALLRRLATFLRARSWRRLRGASLASFTAAAKRIRLRPVRESAIEAALGVLVFIPLLVTWAGLKEAASAYGELSVADPKEASRPFLQLWQSGFGGRVSPLGRFDSVALMAVLLISLLVVVAVWHGHTRSRTEREHTAQEGEREHVLGSLASTLTRAQLLLAAHRKTSPQRFTAELTRAATVLEALAGKAMRSNKSLVRAADAAQGAATALDAASQRLTNEVPALGTAADRIEEAVRTGTAALRSAQDETVRTGADNATAVRAVGDRVGQAGALIEAALKDLAAVQQALLGKSENVVEATDRASQALVSSAGRTGDAVDGMREAAERWDAAAAHWQDAAARLDSGIQQLTGTAAPSAGVLPPVGTHGRFTAPPSTVSAYDGNGVNPHRSADHGAAAHSPALHEQGEANGYGPPRPRKTEAGEHAEGSPARRSAGSEGETRGGGAG